MSIVLDEYDPIYFRSFDDEYDLPTKSVHPLYPVNRVGVEQMIYTFNPVDAVHEEKEREEKERVEIESAFPPLIYNAPPFDVAVQEMNVTEEIDSLYREERVVEIAPPFSDEQSVNVASQIV